jgi:hypothetical protein
MKKLSSYIVVFLLMLAAAYSAEFKASLNQNPVTQGERFAVSYSIDTDASNFRGPDFRGLKVISGPNTSQSVQIVNGAMSRSLTYTYYVYAEKEGTFNIAPATIRVNGETLKSNSLEVKVLPPSEAEKQRRQAQQNRESQISTQARDFLDKNIFINANISKKEAYIGEPINATYKLYIHPQVSIIGNDEFQLSFDGFWVDDLELASRSAEIVNGVRYDVYELKRAVLYPQKTGQLKIDPLEMGLKARLQVQSNQRRRSLFDDFFNRGEFRDFEYKAKSPGVTINVKDTPAGAPPSFSGAVGDFKMEAWFDNTQGSTNEPMSLKVKISGKGNMKMIEPLNIEFPPDFEVYDPKTSDNTKVSPGGTTGNKVFEYLIIPRNAGEFKISPVEFSYFDLNDKSYKTLSSEPFVLQIAKGKDAPAGGVVAGVTKEDIKYLGKDIRFIKTDAKLYKDSESFFGTTFFYVMLIAPIGLVFVVFVAKRKNEELSKDKMAMKNRFASKVVKKRLALSKKYLDTNDKDNFFDEISRALWGYLSDKLSIPTAELTKDKASDALARKNIKPELSEKYLYIIEQCEFARYAPADMVQNMNEIYEEAAKAITELEGGLK